MNNQHVAAVIVTYNNPEMLQNLLSDLQSQSRPLDEVIIIDNSEDDKAEYIVKAKFPTVNYFRMPENNGSAGGYNEGMKKAVQKNALIWTLDDDVALRRDTLEKLISGMYGLDFRYSVGAVRSVGDNHCLKPIWLRQSAYLARIFSYMEKILNIH
jgi:rhamnopyranosyl-N-acetylglucosaminyl-diphospho-decaprenol beta-1,3/1,4-galactofuranosyltransferase